VSGLSAGLDILVFQEEESLYYRWVLKPASSNPCLITILTTLPHLSSIERRTSKWIFNKHSLQPLTKLNKLKTGYVCSLWAL
jgi:hypothetical protein